MVLIPGSRMGPPPRSFAADAHDCIMVSPYRDLPNTSLRREDPRPNGKLPLIVIPTTTSMPSCSELSRCGLAGAEHAERLVRRPTLTAPARAGFAILRVGAKKRDSKSNKETGMKEESRECCEIGA